MAFDYKKEYKEFYLPPKKPLLVDIPEINFVSVRGAGNPNEEGGEYKKAIEMLYAVSYTIKMSKKSEREIDGYFDYVVPPLEGFWWQNGIVGADCFSKNDFQWLSCIRLPDFVSEEDVEWAKNKAETKKKIDVSAVGFLKYKEGLCVQCMHLGPYDDEPATVKLMEDYAEKEGYAIDITDERRHHEIYLSNAGKVAPERLKTVIRHPVRKI